MEKDNAYTVSADLLKAVLDSSLDAIQVFKALRDERGVIIDFIWIINNKKAVEQNGHITGEHLLQHKPDMIANGIFARMAEVVETGIPYQGEHYYTQEQFKNEWFFLSLAKQDDGVVMTTHNIDTQKRDNILLRQNKELLQGIINAPNIGIAVYRAVRDRQGQITDFVHEYINQRTLIALGKDMTGRLLSEHEESGSSQLPEFIKTIETQTQNSYVKHAAFANSEHWVLLSNAPLDKDRLVHTWEDITEIKKTELELIKTKEELAKRAVDKYETLFNSIDEGVVTFEVIFDMNERAVDMLYLEINAMGYSMSGLPLNAVGKRTSELIPELEPFWFNTYERIVKTGKPQRFQHQVKGLENRWFDLHVSRVGEEGSRVLVSVFTNITERKRAEVAQKYLLTLSDTLRSLVDPSTVISTSCKMLCEHLKAGRVSYADIVGEEFIVRDSYSVDMPPIKTRWSVSIFSETALREYNLNGAISVSDVATDSRFGERERKLYEESSIAATLSVMLVKNRKWVVSFSVNSSTPREWTTSELALVKETAERTWAAAEKTKAEESLRESENRLRIVLSGIGEPFYALDGDWRFLFVSMKALETWQRSQEDILGKHFLDAFPNAAGSEAYAAHQRVMETGIAEHLETKSSVLGYWIELDLSVTAEGGLSVSFRDVSARKAAEQALRISENKYRSLFTAMTEGYCIIEVYFDADRKPFNWKFIEVNEAFEKNNGLRDAAGKTILELAPGIEPKWFDIYGKIASNQQPLYFEEHSAALGRWFSLFAFPVGEPDQNLLTVIFTDITQRKKTELTLQQNTKELIEQKEHLTDLNHKLEDKIDERTAELKENNVFIESVMGIIPDIISVVELPSRKPIYWNVDPVAITGYTLAELEQMPIEQSMDVLVFGDDRKALNAYYNALENMMSEEMIQVEYRFRKKTGGLFWFRLRGCIFKRNAEGKPTQLLNIGLEVTEEKESQGHLRDALDQFRTVVNNTPDFITRWDADAKMIFANEGFERKTGFAISASLGKTKLQMGLPEHIALPWAENIKRVFKTKKTIDHFNTLPLSTGDTAFFSQLVPEFDLEGKVISVLAIGRDINDLKKAERELGQLKLGQQKEILNAIIMSQENERRRIGEELHDGVAQLLYGMHVRLQNIETGEKDKLNTLLEIVTGAIKDTRQLSFELVPTVLKDHGLEVALRSLFQRIIPSTLAMALNYKSPKKRPDETVEFAIYRIMQELVNNVVKHANGTKIDCSITITSKQISLSVKDNGNGFDIAALDPMKMGIGLQSVKNRIELLNGDIEIQSTTKGTYISINLPVGRLVEAVRESDASL